MYGDENLARMKPSSEETTQFDLAEDEEKTSFWSDCSKIRGEYTSFFVSFKGS